MTRITFLSTGAMGSRMAARLLEAGHEVVVWNRTAPRTDGLVQAGAARAETPRAAARDAEVVISMARDDAAARTIWLDEETGALGGLSEGAIAIESATVTPDWARRLGEGCVARGVDFLDAPVVGSRPQAEAGALIFLVGGAAPALERARPILEAMGAAVHHVGPVGSGAALKLAVNAFFGIQVAALGELLAFLENAGIAPTAAAALLGALPVTSPAAKGAAAAIAAGNYAPLFPIALVEKDFGYAMASAEARGAALPVTAFVRGVFAEAIARGHGGENINAVARLRQS